MSAAALGVWWLGGCAAPHPRHARSRGQGEALAAGRGSLLCSGLLSATRPAFVWRGDAYGDRRAAPGCPPRPHPAVLVPGREMQRLGWLGVHTASASSRRWGLCPAAVPPPRRGRRELDDGEGGLAARAGNGCAEGGSGPGGWWGAGGRGGGVKQPCCSREALGKLPGPGCHRRKVPQLRAAGEPWHWVLCQGLSRRVWV